MADFCFVIDAESKPLAPTNVNRGWYLIRKNRAALVERFPMVIKLHKIVENPSCNTTLGIDDGSKYTGIAVIQECSTKNKCVFKGTLEHRQDVKKLLEQRARYRKLRRFNKRHRKPRFSNRKNSKRLGRVAPSILQKRQAVIRLLNKLCKWIPINHIILEDVSIDIRALTDGYRPYKWQYQKSNRLDENLRKATIIRDDNKCCKCGKRNQELQVHHIVPKRMKGADILANLITLCVKCHESINGCEYEFIQLFQKKIEGQNIRFDYAQHVMQGKHWLRNQLSILATLELTDGGTTANHRIDWGIEKSHVNDAVVITGLYPTILSQKDWDIRPKRKKRKMKHKVDVCGFRHGDYAKYTDTKGVTWSGYITAIYPDKKQFNLQCKTKHLKRVNATKSTLLAKYPQLSMF